MKSYTTNSPTAVRMGQWPKRKFVPAIRVVQRMSRIRTVRAEVDWGV